MMLPVTMLNCAGLPVIRTGAFEPVDHHPTKGVVGTEHHHSVDPVGAGPDDLDRPYRVVYQWDGVDLRAGLRESVDGDARGPLSINGRCRRNVDLFDAGSGDVELNENGEGVTAFARIARQRVQSRRPTSGTSR